MNRRIALFGAALLGAFAVSAGVLATLDPFQSAHADLPSDAMQEDYIAEALSDFEPGAVVKLTENGGFSIFGKRKLTPAIEQMNHLEKGGPQNIRCSGRRSQLTCTPVEASAVVDALKRGETIYGRAVYGDIPTDINATRPILTADDLVCGKAGSDGSMACTPVGVAMPTIAADATTFVTYKPFRVMFDGDRMIARPELPTIALERRSK
jgi:hypothetical protein